MRRTILFTLLFTLTSLSYLKAYRPDLFSHYFEKNKIEEKVSTPSQEAPAVYINENKFVPEVKFDKETRSFEKKELAHSCNDDPAICAVDLAVKCSINPTLDFCDKKRLPRFIFMEDKSLGRPSFINYNVLKIHPIDANTVEVQTQSTCDGVWFGLCDGNIIYVVNKDKDGWRVKDLYALESYL